MLFKRWEFPPIFADTERYRPFLRKDFLYRCAYCERPEIYLGGAECFEIDHFRPRSKFPWLDADYSNLYYCCAKCNRYKGDSWPEAALAAAGYRFADPCAEDVYRDHLREQPDGDVEAITKCGEYSRAHLRLGRPDVRQWRVRRRAAQAALTGLGELLGMLMMLDRGSADEADRTEIERNIACLGALIEDTRDRFGF